MKVIQCIYTPFKKLNWYRKSYRHKLDVLVYIILGMIITAGVTWTLAWWAVYSNQLLMGHYRYSFDAITHTEGFENITTENPERVKQLEIEYFGIGWPLKAIMMFVLYLPYLPIVYLIGFSKRFRPSLCGVYRSARTGIFV